MPNSIDIFTGNLCYRDIDFTFVFSKKELRLIPPSERVFEIEHEWFMQKIGEGIYDGGVQPQMEESYLTGQCNENNKSIVFITLKGANIGRNNSVLVVKIIAFMMLNKSDVLINRISFSSPEINHIYKIGQSFSILHDEEFTKNGVVHLRTSDSQSVNSKPESFNYIDKTIEVTFGAVRTISYFPTESPLKINSCLNFKFDSSNDYVFIYRLWWIAKQFLQFLCYRRNVYFYNCKISTPYDKGRSKENGEFYALEDLERIDEEIGALEKGRFINQRSIKGFVGSILQSIADEQIYLRHLPKSYMDGRMIDAARFVMITAAFEWEFSRVFPEGVEKKQKKIDAEEKVSQLLQELIDQYSGEVKGILKYLKKNISHDPLEQKLAFVGRKLGSIVDLFGNRLYEEIEEGLNYNEMGRRLAQQRNNFAHGNIDKDFNRLALLDLSYLELILYAMQLKYYDVEETNIKNAINDLFQKHLIIENAEE